MREHQCAYELEDRYFESNYSHVMQVLYNARFIDAIQQFLAARNIHQDSSMVSAVAQAYLYELTLVNQVSDPLNDLQDQLDEQGPDIKNQLEAATQYWSGY